MKKRIVSIVLAICMVLVLVPTSAFAEGDPAPVPSGPVTNIAVTVDEPVIGMEPDYTIDYTMETSEGIVQQDWTLQATWCEISEDDVTYTDEDKWREMETGDKFRAGYIYYVGIAFANHEKYPFTQETKATVNGNPNYDGFMDLYQEGGACVFGVFVPLKYVSSEDELRAAITEGITMIMLTDDFTINEQPLIIGSGQTLTIPKGVTLTFHDAALGIQQGAVLMIQQGAALTSYGGFGIAIETGGKIYVDEKVDGILQGSSTYYLLNVENTSASVEPAENLSEYEGKTYVSAGSTITLTPDHPPAGYWFVGWDVSSDSTVTVGADHKFTMPNAAVTAAPRWEVIYYEPVSPKPIVGNDDNTANSTDDPAALLTDQQLTARSKLVTMKNGKKAVKITWYNENGELMDFDGVEIYRSTRRNAGYGKTPFFTTEKDAYYNTAIKKGTTYYYRVRGYVVIDGQKYYTDYSRKAIRTVK